MREKYTNKGITLITLVITIIILLILSTTVLNMLFGENGLVTMAQKAKKSYEESVKSELGELEEIFKGKFADYNGKLRLDGTSLINQYNEQIQLMGLVAERLSEASQHAENYEKKQFFSYYLNQESINTLKTWGVNVIRLGLKIGDFESEEKINDFFETVDLLIENDLYVITLLWNNNNPNQNIDIAKDFFKSVARRYENTPNIIYEIANEPTSDTEWKEIVEYSNAIIPLIREYSKDNIIIVPCRSVDMRPDEVNMDDLVEKTNVMVSYHLYVGNALTEENIRIFRGGT